MVFQQFNLLDSKTVFHNIALPLILEKAPKDVIEKKVNEVLRFVELEDKKRYLCKSVIGWAEAESRNCKSVDHDARHSAL